MEWSSRMTTISLEMVAPTVAGYWLGSSGWVRGVLFLVSGAILGFVTALLSLLKLTRPPDRDDRGRLRTTMIIWLAELRHRGIVVRALAIGVAVLLMFALAAPAAVRWGGSDALAAAGVAAGLCLAGAVMALAVGSLLRQSQMMMASLMLGMASRMGIPLAFGLAIHLHGGPLAEAGLLYYLLMFYPVTLAGGDDPVAARDKGSELFFSRANSRPPCRCVHVTNR